MKSIQAFTRLLKDLFARVVFQTYIRTRFLCTRCSLMLASAALLATSATLPAHARAAHCPTKPSPISAERMHALSAHTRDRGLLYELQYQGHKGYLYGTIHINSESAMLPGPQITLALLSSEVLALELNLMDHATIAELLQLIRRSAHTPALDAHWQRRLDALKQRECVDGDAAFEGMHPIMQTITLGMEGARRVGLHTEYGVDLVLMGAAHAMGKTIVGLETPAQQMRTLIKDEPAAFERSMHSAIEQLENQAHSLHVVQTLFQAWEQGDAQRLANYEQWCECIHTAQQLADWQALIRDRNPSMAHAIVELLASGRSVFAAAGALHLVGEHNLPELLRAAGVQVKAVPLHEGVREAARR